MIWRRDLSSATRYEDKWMLSTSRDHLALRPVSRSHFAAKSLGQKGTMVRGVLMKAGVWVELSWGTVLVLGGPKAPDGPPSPYFCEVLLDLGLTQISGGQGPAMAAAPDQAQAARPACIPRAMTRGCPVCSLQHLTEAEAGRYRPAYLVLRREAAP